LKWRSFAMEVDLRRVNVDRLLRGLGIEAKREDNQWVARCPTGSHPDNKPSWQIRDEPRHEKHSLHSCWSCHWSGNAVTLARDIIKLDNIDSAREWVLKNAYDDSAPEVASVRVEVPSLGTKPFQLPLGVVVEQLANWPPVIRNYVKRRGITEQQAFRWKLGWSLEGRLAMRVVIPIRDQQETLLSYQARAVSDNAVRYLTPSNDEGADKTAIFGEQYWGRGFAFSGEDFVAVGATDMLAGSPHGDVLLDELSRSGAATVYVCEGALNALAVERACFGCNIAALGGSKFLPGHALRLSRFNRVFVLTDNDPAGDDAAHRLEQILGRRAEVKRIELPKGKDPNDLPEDVLRRLLSSAAAA
jgi:hypothetical protein